MATENPIRFKSLLAWSSDTQVVAPALVPQTFTWTISEEGISGQYQAGEDTQGIFQNLRHRNVNLSTGQCPMSLLHPTSCTAPRLRRYVSVNDPMSMQVASTAGSGPVSLGLSTAPVKGLPDFYEGDAYRDYTRNILAFGGFNVATIAPGATNQFRIDLAQSGQAGFLVIGCADNPLLQNLVVTECTYDNDPLLDGAAVPAATFRADKQAPILSGAILQTNHVFTVTVQNNSPVAATDVAVCVTAG
jgi:hypothetical protein